MMRMGVRTVRSMNYKYLILVFSIGYSGVSAKVEERKS